MPKVYECTFEQFCRTYHIDPVHYNPFGTPMPAVFRRESMTAEKKFYGYGIRIAQSESWSANGTRRQSWEYFDLDETGLITSSPRGQAKRFNKRVRITDMDAAAKASAKDLNERMMKR